MDVPPFHTQVHATLHVLGNVQKRSLVMQREPHRNNEASPSSLKPQAEEEMRRDKKNSTMDETLLQGPSVKKVYGFPDCLSRDISTLDKALCPTYTNCVRNASHGKQGSLALEADAVTKVVTPKFISFPNIYFL